MPTMIDDPTLEPPVRPDFRRVNKGVPLVVDPHTGKRVRYKRSSSAGKVLDDESNLVDWRIRTTIVGAAQRPDLMAQVSTLDPNADKGELRDIAEECLVAGKGAERRNTGTAIHKMLDHVDLEHDWQPAPQFAGAVKAYTDALDAYGLVVVDVECHCVNDQFGTAGTMDRRYRTTRNLIVPDGTMLPIGSVLAADTKTGQSLEYASGSYTTQLAAYAASVRYDVVTDERTEFDPPTNQEWGLIFHVSADDARCDVYWVDLVAGRHALELAHNVRAWRKRTDLIVPAVQPLRVVHSPSSTSKEAERVAASRANHPSARAPASEPAAVLVHPDGQRPLDGHTRPSADDVRAWLRARVSVIRDASDEGTAMLLREWPQGVPGLKYDTQTDAELDAISEACWRVEERYSLTFPLRDPRVPDMPAEWAKHPRAALLAAWVGTNPPLAEALHMFASFTADHSDDECTLMLDGTLRAIGYAGGVDELANVDPAYLPHMISSALALETGNALVLWDEDERPVVRVITQIIQ